MKNKTTLVIIAIIGVLITAVFLFWQNGKTIQKSGEVTTKEDINSMSEPDTSNWLTYENKDYGYRFKYPHIASVVDDKNHPYNFDFPRAVIIDLPEKYTELRDPRFYNEDTISIRSSEESKGVDDIVQNIIDKNLVAGFPLQKIRTIHGAIVLLDEARTQAYIVNKNDVYIINLMRRNPDHMEWLDDEQLKKAKEYYLEEIYILEGVYSTFEVLD